MKKILLFILITLLLGAFPRTAHSYEEGAIVPSAVIAPLMAWVEAETGIKVPYLPKVMASHSTLNNIVSHMNHVGRGHPRAVYFGGIVIIDHLYFDHEDTTQLSLLVHELVHYAQSFTPANQWRCPQAKEHQAYSLQNKWLEQKGSYPIVRASWINRMASCPVQTVVAMN